MSTLADMLRDPSAYRGACGDLCAGALRLSPQELADLTLQVAGQSPQRAREIVAQFLSKTPAAEEILPPGQLSETQPTPQPPAPPQPVADDVPHLPPAPQLEAKPVSATPTSSDSAGTTAKTRRSKGSLLGADQGAHSNAD